MHAPYCHPWPAPLYNIFAHYLINGTDFENGTEHKKRVLIFSTNLSVTFLILGRTERDIIIHVYRSSLKVPLFLSDFHET